MKTLTTPILLIGAPDTDLDIRYLSGFSASDPVVYLQDRKRKYLVVSTLEKQRAERVTQGITVWSLQDLRLSRVSGRKIHDKAIGLLRKAGVKSIVVSPAFPVGTARKLTEAGIHITIAENTLIPQRQIKTPDELLKIRESQKAAVLAMQKAIAMIAHSRVNTRGYLMNSNRILTSEMVQTEIKKKLLDYNCSGRGTIVAGGKQAADPHESGSGPLRQGESIVIDIFPQNMSHGYWGDLSRTVVKGPVSPMLKKMYRAVKAAQRAALSKVKAGVSVAAVHKSAVNVIAERGFKTGVINGEVQGFIHSTGHGVGLEIHESPGIRTRHTRLRSGNVITVEPGLYYRDKGGIRIEDLIVVTPGGWNYIGRCAHVFKV